MPSWPPARSHGASRTSPTYPGSTSRTQPTGARFNPTPGPRRHLNPLPRNLGDLLGRYRTVLVPEINLGQLLMVLRAKYLVDAIGYDKVRGKPFRISEIHERAEQILAGR